MIKFICLSILFAIATPCLKAQEDKEVTLIKDVLKLQTEAWNKGDIDAFMSGYWKNENLKFIGKNGITYGWQKTLDNYKKNYPDKDAMGFLTFDILTVEKISKDAYFVIGKWHLKRTKNEPQGHFSLLWKKIDGLWVIVADHSS